MGAGGVVTLKFVVDFGGGLQLFLQAVGPDQGGGAVHLVEVPDLLGDLKEGGVVVQLLLHQFLAEHAAQLLRRHGLVGARVQQGGGLVFHVGADIVPRSGQFVLGQINLVGNFVLAHGSVSF